MVFPLFIRTHFTEVALDKVVHYIKTEDTDMGDSLAALACYTGGGGLGILTHVGYDCDPDLTGKIIIFLIVVIFFSLGAYLQMKSAKEAQIAK